MSEDKPEVKPGQVWERRDPRRPGRVTVLSVEWPHGYVQFRGTRGQNVLVCCSYWHARYVLMEGTTP